MSFLEQNDIILIKEVEKARRVLSADTEAQISVDYFIDEIDLEKELNREAFHDIIEP